MGDSANTQGNNHIDFEYDSDQAITNVVGERRHIKFGPASETDGKDGAKKYNGILTCLKANNLYSFSILIDNDDILSSLSSFIKTLSKSNDIKIVNKVTNNKYIYNFTNSNKYLDNIASIYDGNQDNYMLIIGHLQDEEQKLYVEKIILIINNPFVNGFVIGDKIYSDLLTAEEYLNLYYIEHFSLNIPNFIKDKYAAYKESTSSGTGETAEGEETEREGQDLNESSELANRHVDKVMQDVLDKIPDGEGADGPTTVGPNTVGPATGNKLEGGGKKLAKVKKIKNKKK